MEDAVCRYCWERGEEEKLLSPCKCTGTIGYVHRSCVLESKCTICPTCKEPFCFPPLEQGHVRDRLLALYEDDIPEYLRRRMREVPMRMEAGNILFRFEKKRYIPQQQQPPVRSCLGYAYQPPTPTETEELRRFEEHINVVRVKREDEFVTLPIKNAQGETIGWRRERRPVDDIAVTLQRVRRPLHLFNPHFQVLE